MIEPRVLRVSEFTLGRPYHAALARLTSRESMGPHVHQDYFEFFYVLDGVGKHWVSAGSQALQAGDLVFIGPDEWHYLRTTAPEGLELINVAVPLGYWQSVVDLTGTDPTADRLRGAPPKLVKSSAATAEMLDASFRRALERCARGPTRFDLLRLIIDVLELLADTSDPDERSGRPDWLVRARRAMDREDNLRVGVGRFVELAAVSPAHLSRSVRVGYDTTPTALVTDLRLRHAEMLLATSSLSVTEIAERCGFSSLPYFSKCFRATEGVSPREFRRRARESVLP